MDGCTNNPKSSFIRCWCMTHESYMFPFREVNECFIEKKVLIRDWRIGHRIHVGSVTDPPHLISSGFTLVYVFSATGTSFNTSVGGTTPAFRLFVVVYLTHTYNFGHAWFCTYRRTSSVSLPQLSGSAALKTLPVGFHGRWSKTVMYMQPAARKNCGRVPWSKTK